MQSKQFSILDIVPLGKAKQKVIPEYQAPKYKLDYEDQQLHTVNQFLNLQCNVDLPLNPEFDKSVRQTAKSDQAKNMTTAQHELYKINEQLMYFEMDGFCEGGIRDLSQMSSKLAEIYRNIKKQ